MRFLILSISDPRGGELRGGVWCMLAHTLWTMDHPGFAIWGQLLKRYPAATVAPFSLLVPIFRGSVGSVHGVDSGRGRNDSAPGDRQGVDGASPSR